jgi:hypothetical protein
MSYFSNHNIPCLKADHSTSYNKFLNDWWVIFLPKNYNQGVPERELRISLREMLSQSNLGLFSGSISIHRIIRLAKEEIDEDSP